MEQSKNHHIYPKYKATIDGKVINTNYHNRGIEVETAYFTIPFTQYKAFKIYPERKNYLVHRFIWECFNGPIPNGLEIDHIDGDPTNNKLENLKIGTHKENCSNPNTIRKKRETSTSGKKVLVKKRDHSFERVFNTLKEASKFTKVSQLTIRRHCNARREPYTTDYSFSWA